MKRLLFGKAKKRTFRVWLTSYLFVLLIPLIFGVCIYMFAMGTVRQQAEMAQREMLRSVVAQTDRTLQQVQESVIAVLNTSMVDNLGKQTDYTISHYDSMATVQESFKKIKTNSSYIDEIYLYFTKTDYMLTTYSYFKGDQTLFQRTNGMSPEDFDALVSSPSYKELHVYQTYSGPKLFLVNSEINAVGKRNAPRTVLMVSLNVDALTELLRQENSSNWMVDEDGNVMAAGQSELTEELQQIIAEDSEGFWELEDSHVRSWVSEYFDIMYVNQMPRQVYYQEMDRMNQVLAVYLMVCLVGGGILVVMMARKQYRPVEEILASIQKINISDVERGDMERIKKSIDQLQLERENFRQRLESQKRAMQSSVMHNLIKGRHVERYVLEGVPYVKNGFQYRGGFLLAFDVEDASRAFFEEHEDLDDDLLDLVFYVVENIADELLSEKYSVFISEADGILLCLVNAEQRRSLETLQDLRGVADQIVQFLEEKFAVKLSASISDYHENWTGIEQCYHDIQDIMDYRSVNGVEESVLVYGALEAFWLHQEETEESRTEEQSSAASGEDTAETHALEHADVSDTKVSAGEIAEMVVAYIHENYRDQDLSVGKIADEFGISLSYLSQIFKRTMKTGLLEYIHLQRIEEAKKLLLEGMSVQSVAEAVGYYNTRPLIRMFKRIENMTPTEYKESKKEE